MFLRCPWFPTLLIWQQLWLLVLAFPLPERYWVPLTTKPELSPEPRSFPPLPALPDNPTPGLQPEYDDLASSAPSQELAPGLPQVQPEAQTRNSKPAKVQSSLPQEEVKDQLSQPPEEAEPSITQQDAHAQYELGTENTGQRLMQGANVPSGNRNETQHSNMAFVTVRPVDVKVTKSTEAGKKPQPTSSQLQTLTQPTESPEEEEPSSTQQQILAQTLELSEETETPSTYQEAPAQPLGPLGESELSATKTKPAQLSESSRTEEPSEIQLKAPDQPSDWETEELETSPTQLKQPAQFSEHGKERLPTPHHHKAKHPHLTHVTGKPLNLQLAITPEPTTEEGNFPVLPEAAAQPSTPVNDVEPSISQQEAPNLFSEPSQGAELLQFHREAPATSSELAQQETQVGNPHTFEEGEPSWTTQEAAAQPPELPNELIPEPPELQEKTVSPLGDEQVQPPTLTRGAVTPAELLSSEVEIKISTAQEAPAQSSVSLEQFESLGDNQELTTPQPNPAIKDELSSSDSKVPTPPAELAGEYSPDQPRSLAMSPGSSGVAVSPVQQELAAQSSGLPGKVTLSPLLTGRVTFSAQPSEPPEDTEPFSVPQEEDAAPLSEPPNEMESSQAQKMTPPQRAEEEPSPAPPPAASTPPDPPEEVELSSTLPKTLPQLPSEPPNEGAAHPPPRSETTVPTPAQGQAQQPRGAFHPLNLEATIIPERTTDGEFSTALKNATALPLKHHKVTLPPPDWVQTQHSKLSLLTVRPLHQKLISAPGISAKVRSFPTMPEIPSQPPEPPKVVQTPASHEVKAVTPGLEPAQHPTSPTVTDQPLNPELTTAVLTVETQVSVPLQEAASPPPEPSSQAQKMTPPQRAEEEPSPAPPPAASTPPDPPEEVELSSTLPKTLPQLPSEPPNEGAAHPPPRSETTVPTPAQGQAQQPRGAFHPLNLEATIIPERTTDGEFSTALKNATALPLKHHKVTLPPPDWVQTQHSKLSLLTVRPLHQKLISAPGISAKVRSFPTMPEIPSQPPEPPKVVQTPASHEVKAVTPGLEPAQHPTSPTVTDQPLNPELTTAVLTVETQVSVPLQEAASPPPEPSSQAQKMTPPQRAEEEPSPALPPAASTPPDPPEEVELSSTLPKTLPQLPSEPPNEGAAHPPPRSETTVPTPAQGQAQQPRGAFHPLNLEATIIPERTTDGEFSTALKNATALPLKHHKVTLPPPDWVQTQHSKLSLLTVRPLHQKLISAPGISAKVRSFPTMPEIPSQPPEPPKVVQTPASHEVKAVTPGLEPAQYPTSPTVTDQPLNPELTTAVLTVETQVSVPLQEAASPPPEQPQVMLTQPEQVQAQHPNPAEVTVQPLDVEFVVTQYSVSHSPGKASTVQEKQNATTNTDICELCTCQHETLSCAGLSPKHKLHQVPVLEPNNTFTTFNFQENNILHIGETSWTTYRWAEKLNLSENGLTALHKNSFKGLLSLHYLDLSCNKIQFIEAQTFEALPFLQVLNLRCNLVKQISFGTFRAWHGMQFLHKVILNHNPLSSVEDSYLFKLPALRYLDLGTTYTPLPVVQNIIMMTLTLKTLIIPRPMACCLCQFKSDIEVVCKTVKLHCDSECVTNPKQCLEEAPVGNAEGVFMRALEARKKNTETELVIESGKSSSEQSDVSWSDFMDEELNSNDENDVVGALNYSLPNFSEVNLEGVDPLLPLIQRLFSNIQNEANPQGYMKGNMKNPSDQPVSSSSAYRNELKKQYLLQSWLDAEIQEKIEEIKKKKKTGMLMQSSLSSPKLQIVPDVPEKLASTQAQENSLVEDQHEERRLRTEHRVLKGPKGIRKGLLKERQKQVVREKQSTQPLAENTEDGRSLRSPSTGKLGQNEGVLGPGNLLHTEQKVPVSPTLQDPLLGRSATSALAKAPHGVRNGAEDLTNSIWVLENASMRVKSMKAFKPSLPSKKHYGFHTTASLKAHRILKANPREQLTKEDAHGRPKIVEGPLFSAPRNLPHPPSQGLRSSSGEPRVQDHPFPELYDPSKTSTGSSAVENQTSENTSKQNAFTINSPVSATDSALTLISDDHTNERHWEYTSTSTEPPPPETSVPLLSSPRDGFESQLNQQLHLLVPNKEVRRLISHVTRTLKTDCSEPRMHLACAKLITRTGLLMKLLSEQQEEAVAQAHIKETYKSSGASSNQKVQGEPRDHTQEVLGHTYKNKLIVATSVMAALTLLVFIFCLIEICSHRTASEKAKEGTSSSICGQRRKHSAETDSQEDFSPDSLSDIQQQSMVQELQDDDSSDEDNNTGETSEAPSEAEESTKAAG